MAKEKAEQKPKTIAKEKKTTTAQSQKPAAAKQGATATQTVKVSKSAASTSKQDNIAPKEIDQQLLTSKQPSKQQKIDKSFGIDANKKKRAPENLEGVVQSLTEQLIEEHRHSRRWGIFFKLVTFTFLFLTLGLIFYIAKGADTAIYEIAGEDDGNYTAVISVHGIIAPGETASADRIIDSLQAAFEEEGTRGIILDINSPGGSPVQAGQIYDEIDRLQQEYPDIGVYAVISDLGASGAYYIAAAADEIYADKSSLVGSIGVISSGFGFTELMETLGIDRRLTTAGKNKAFLDPFSKEDKELTAFWQSVLDVTHQQFIESVVKARGDKITNNSDVFTGLIYNGEQAIDIGLIDALGDKRMVARDIIGYKQLRYFDDANTDWLELARRFGSVFGTAIGQSLVHVSQEPTLR